MAIDIDIDIDTCAPRPRARGIFRTRLTPLLAIAALLLGSVPAVAQDRSWVGTWLASSQPIWGTDFAFPTKIPLAVRDMTFRQVVRISLGGSRLRFVFSNAYGDAPLRIAGASVALPGGVWPRTMSRCLTPAFRARGCCGTRWE